MLPTIPTIAARDGGVSGSGGAAAPATVRKWNDDDSQLRVPVVSQSNLTDSLSVLALINPDGTKNNFESMIAGFTSAGVALWSFGTDTNNVPFFYTASGNTTLRPVSGGVITPGSYWLIAYCKNSTGGERFFRIAQLGQAASHIAGDTGGNIASPDAATGGYLNFGGTDGNDDLDALMAVAAVSTSFLSEAAFNAIAAGAASALLASNGFGGAWNFNQANASDAVADQAGNHVNISGTITGPTDTNGITGTTIVSGSAPAWTF